MDFIEVEPKKSKEITLVGMVKTIEIWKKGKNEEATDVSDDYYNTLEDEANEYIARMKTGNKNTD
jgi:DNA-binding transcriptional regulator/RsmH inhibitor MraZ